MATGLRLRVSSARHFLVKIEAVVAGVPPAELLEQPTRLPLQSSLFVTQRLHWIEAGGKISGDQCGKRANQKRADANDRDVLRDDLGWNRRELIDFTRENLDVQCRSQPVAEFVAVANEGHAQSEAGECSEESDHGSLTEKDPNDLREVCAERFHDSDLAPL